MRWKRNGNAVYLMPKITIAPTGYPYGGKPMATSKFADLPPDDPLRLKIEAKVLEVQKAKIYSALQELHEVGVILAWWKTPIAKLGIKQSHFAERIIMEKLKQKTKAVNDAIVELYGEEPPQEE